jgi:hypothetical protein
MRKTNRLNVRVLSVKQPWAGLAMAGVKRFEVRPWRPSTERGLLLLHASSGTATGLRGDENEPLYWTALEEAEMQDRKAWPRSAILGVIEIRRVWHSGRRPKLTKLDRVMCGSTEGQALWEIGRRWNFATPVPCGGQLHFWPIPQERGRAVSSQLARFDLPNIVWLQKYVKDV